MKYKVGDRVRIKGIDWHNMNKDKDGDIVCGEFAFLEGMKKFCSETLTILEVVDDGYLMLEDDHGYVWTDEMFEALVERNGKTYPYKIGDRVVLKGNNQCATITDLKCNSLGDLLYYIRIDNDRHSIYYPTELLLPYKEPKFKVGDRVIVRGMSGIWEITNLEDDILYTIKRENHTFTLTTYGGFLTLYEGISDKMIECEVEEETKPKFKVGDKIKLKSTLLNDIFGVIGYEPEGYRITNISNGLTYFMSYSIEHYYELVEEEGKETSWKPSKEEMDVLYGLAYITNKYDEHKEEVITRLYQDLKREFFNDSSYENMFPNTENDVRRRSTIQVLEYARSLDNYNQYGKADIDKNIAWLEKQGKFALEARTDNELVEEEVGLVDNFSSRWGNEFELPNGYIFKDENGNIINATKIVLEKKKKEYPKSYEECCEILEDVADCSLCCFACGLLNNLQKLLICRDAYWKIAGEEMGLGKPWKPDYDSGVDKFGIICLDGVVQESNPTTNWERHLNKVLDFPTREMRDAFYENFKSEIEICKELL